MTKTVKTLITIIALVLILCSTAYITVEYTHKCAHQIADEHRECPICQAFDVINAALSHIQSVNCLAATIVCLSIHLYTDYKDKHIPTGSFLVKNKVRLNN